jgi:hypothetical protein
MSQFIAIKSVHFENAFLRMDGSNVTQFQIEGSGTVNCQFYGPGQFPVPEIGNYEAFELIPIPNVNEGFAIRSVSFPNAFLRIDGLGVNASQGAGVGTVNCQYYTPGTLPNSPVDFEVFKVLMGNANVLVNGYVESTAFPHVFLRMDGSTVNGFSGVGSGTVNGQFYPSGVPNIPADYELLNVVFL